MPERGAVPEELRDREVSVRALLPLIGSSLALALLYGAGFVIAAVDRKKRAIHDRIAGSRVVYRLAPRAQRGKAG